MSQSSEIYRAPNRLANLDVEAVNWPESEYNEMGNEVVYHSTSQANAVDIVNDEVYNPMEDDMIDSLRVFALRDQEAVEEGKIRLDEYLEDNLDQISEEGLEPLKEGINSRGVEEIGDLLRAYDFAEMDVSSPPTDGARRRHSLHVGNNRELTKTQSNFGSDVTFELEIPERARHNSDIPGEIPFSYTTAIYINETASPEISQQIEEMIEEYPQIEIIEDF